MAETRPPTSPTDQSNPRGTSPPPCLRRPTSGEDGFIVPRAPIDFATTIAGGGVGIANRPRIVRSANSRPKSHAVRNGKPIQGISRKERIGLFLHRSLDKLLSPIGVWVYQWTRGGITRPWKVVPSCSRPAAGGRGGSGRSSSNSSPTGMPWSWRPPTAGINRALRCRRGNGGGATPPTPEHPRRLLTPSSSPGPRSPDGP